MAKQHSPDKERLSSRQPRAGPWNLQYWPKVSATAALWAAETRTTSPRIGAPAPRVHAPKPCPFVTYKVEVSSTVSYRCSVRNTGTSCNPKTCHECVVRGSNASARHRAIPRPQRPRLVSVQDKAILYTATVLFSHLLLRCVRAEATMERLWDFERSWSYMELSRDLCLPCLRAGAMVSQGSLLNLCATFSMCSNR